MQLVYLKRLQPLSSYRAVIIAGTKSTCSDLAWLHKKRMGQCTAGLGRCRRAHIGLDNIEVNWLHGPAARDRAYDLLAEHTARQIDVNAILHLIGLAGNL